MGCGKLNNTFLGHVHKILGYVDIVYAINTVYTIHCIGRAGLTKVASSAR